MPAFGPTANGAQYGANLKKQRELGPVSDSSQAYDDDLLAGLRVLGSASKRVDPMAQDAEQMQRPAAGGDLVPSYENSVETVAPTNQPVQNPVGPATGVGNVPASVKNRGFTMTAEPGSGAALINDLIGSGGFDPAVETPGTADSREEFVTQDNMPEPVTVDPMESIEPSTTPSLASDLSQLVSAASSEDIKEAKAASQNPEILQAKAEAGQEMSLGEKIALISMIVAPVAMGFAMKGEKGALLGGAAAGKGLEVYGKDMAGREELGQKIDEEKELKAMDIAGDEEKARIKAAEGGQPVRGIRTGLVDGRSALMQVEGGTATPVTDSAGNVVYAPEIDPATGEQRNIPPAAVVGTKTATGQQEIALPEPPKPFQYPMAQGETVEAVAKRKGIDVDSIPGPYRQLDDAAFIKDKHPGESGADAKTRREYAQKYKGMIEDQDKRNKELAQFSAKEDLSIDKAEKKGLRDGFIKEYNETSPWKTNAVIINQSDFRVASQNAQRDQSVITADMAKGRDGKIGLRSDPYPKTMKDAQGIADIGLLYTYIKMLDPTSVVREGEVYMAGAATPVVERMAKAYQNIFQSGSALSAEQRKYINNLISAKVVAAMSNQQKHEIRMEEKANNLGLNWYAIQRADVAAELKNMPEFKRRAQGIPFIKEDDTKSFSKLAPQSIAVIETKDGGWIAGTREKVDDQGNPWVDGASAGPAYIKFFPL